MPVDVMMRDSLDAVIVQGSFEKLIYDINFQMAQGKQLIAVQGMDDLPIAINVNNINTIRAQSMEDAFFKRDD